MFQGFLTRFCSGVRVVKSRHRNRNASARARRLAFETCEDRRLLSVFLKEPYVQDVRTACMTVMWETDAAAGTLVEYRQLGESEWQSAEGDGGVTIHEQALNGLSADTTYEYRVTSDSLVSLSRTFQTAPATPRSFRFVAYGDTRRANPEATYERDNHLSVATGIIGAQPELVLHVGDLVDNGKDAREWDPQFFAPTRNLMGDTPVYPAWGNHEYNSVQGNTNPLVDEYFSLPATDPASGERWYAFTYGNVRFLCLDDNDVSLYNEPTDDQRVWLSAEMQSVEYTTATWQVVFFHQPPYCSRGDNENVKLHLVPIFEANGVDMVFCGHEHLYERYEVNGIQYVITGGGGAEFHQPGDDTVEPLPEYQEIPSCFHHCIIDVSVPAKSLTMRMIRTADGSVGDTVTLTKTDAGPAAELITPADEITPQFDPDNDQDPHAGELLLGNPPTTFVIQLTDADGIDDSSVTSDAVSIVRDGVTIPDWDYAFQYTEEDDQITLTRAGGLTFDLGVYEVRLSETTKIEDLAEHEMGFTTIKVVVEPSWTESTLVAAGSVWSYKDDGSNQGTAWRGPSFVEDPPWDSGPAELGYSPNNEDGAATMVDDGPDNDRYETTYFRHTFNVDKKTDHFDWLALTLLRDDGAAVYLNGAEVLRHNMKTNEAVSYTSLARRAIAGDEESDWYGPFLLDASLLLDGSNVLAVEIHQSSVTSSDISFNLELRAFGSKLTHTFVDNVLEIYGTTADDEIALSANGSGHVTLNGHELSGPVDADDVTEIKVYGYAGDDVIDLSGVEDEDFTALAASGAIRIEGGAGDDELIGSDDFGETYVFSGSGLGTDSINPDQGVSYLEDDDTILVAPDSVASIDGDLVMADEAGYHVQLDGDEEGLLSTGAGDLSLDGTLSLEALTRSVGINAWADETRTIITADPGTISGTFATVPSADPAAHLGKGVFFKGVTYGANAVTVDVLQALGGDATGDHAVDFSDYARLSYYWTGPNPPPGTERDWTQADFDDDDKVDFSDFTIMQFN